MADLVLSLLFSVMNLGVTVHGPQGPEAQDRAIGGLTCMHAWVGLIWSQGIEGSDKGTRVSLVISIAYLGGGISI